MSEGRTAAACTEEEYWLALTGPGTDTEVPVFNAVAVSAVAAEVPVADVAAGLAVAGGRVAEARATEVGSDGLGALAESRGPDGGIAFDAAVAGLVVSPD